MLKPIKHKQYYVEEAPYPFPKMRSGILLGSSGQGKSHLFLSLVLGPLRGLHSRVVIVSPSVHVDPLWQAWKDFVRNHYYWADELDDYLSDSYDEDALREIVNKQELIKNSRKGKTEAVQPLRRLMT